MSQHFHPEFGYFHPVPRFRRDLRLTLASFACGAAIGAVAIVAVNVNYREADNASAAGAVNTVTASAETTTHQHPDSGALIARVPLGRPQGVDHAGSLAAAVETSDAPQAAQASPQQSSRRITGGPSLLHKERSGGSAGALAARAEHAPQAPGAASARGKTVFWEWSR